MRTALGCPAGKGTALVGSLSTLLTVLLTAAPAMAEPVAIGQKAPSFRLKLLHPGPAGEAWADLGTLTDPKATDASGLILLDFFSLSCKPCRRELPILDKLAAQLRDKGLQVFAISIDDGSEEAKVKALVDDELKLTMPVALDRFQIVARRYGVEALPSLVALDRQGTIKQVARGYDGQLFALLGPALKEGLGVEVPQELVDEEARLRAAASSGSTAAATEDQPAAGTERKDGTKKEVAKKGGKGKGKGKGKAKPKKGKATD